MPGSQTPLSRSLVVLWVLVPACVLGVWMLSAMSGAKTPAPGGAGSDQAAVSVEPRADAGATEPPAWDAEPADPETPGVVVSEWTTFESALEESRRTGKPVLIDFNAEWCGPCRRMKEEVFDDWSRGKAVQTAVIPVSIVDRRREDGSNPPEIEELQQRFQVEAFPTLVVLDPATGRGVRTEGFGGGDATVQWITEAARSMR